MRFLRVTAQPKDEGGPPSPMLIPVGNVELVFVDQKSGRAIVSVRLRDGQPAEMSVAVIDSFESIAEQLGAVTEGVPAVDSKAAVPVPEVYVAEWKL